MKPLLKVDEVAKLLKIHPTGLRRLVQKERIPFMRIPGVGIRFNIDKLEEWVKKYRKCKYFISPQEVENAMSVDEKFMKRHLSECYKCKELVDLLKSKATKAANNRWKDEQYVFKYFKGKLYPNISRNKLTITDKEVIKAKVRLFHLQRTEVQ